MKFIILISLVSFSLAVYPNDKLKGDDALEHDFHQLLDEKEINFSVINSAFEIYIRDYFKMDLDFRGIQEYLSEYGDKRVVFNNTIVCQKALIQYKKFGITSKGRIDLNVILNVLENVDKPTRTTRLLTDALNQLIVKYDMNFSVGIFSSLFTEGLNPGKIDYGVYKEIYIFIVTLYIINDNYYHDF